LIRYEVELGHFIIDGNAIPLIMCEVLAIDMEHAELIVDYIGFPEALIRPTNRDIIYPEYMQN